MTVLDLPPVKPDFPGLKCLKDILFNCRCWSYIGHQGGRQQLSLEQPDLKHCNCFCSTGRALHEIMHALGFYHEHSRADRDKYIKIVDKNVRKGKQKNFHTKGDDTTTRNFDYDYDSIMHYGPYYFR